MIITKHGRVVIEDQQVVEVSGFEVTGGNCAKLREYVLARHDRDAIAGTLYNARAEGYLQGVAEAQAKAQEIAAEREMGDKPIPREWDQDDDGEDDTAKVAQALDQARAQGQQEERARTCEACRHKGTRLTPGAYCQLHYKMASEMGNRCGRWEAGGEGRKETT